ncbi:hypothetical protein OIU84_016506 [Salix udensis]|uniref:Uncharacterized protein n=1 Tax=Salix udensis TaxID=889485 RepID=A0AAD6JAL2_9ROSI|nr:hypothetical protein OIU84_016506 [Salix udensis]
MTSLVDPSSFPPMNTAGTGELHPIFARAFFHFPSFRVTVNLINQRVHPDFLEQNFDCIAQATCALDEYHHPLIRGQSQHLFHVVTPD